MSADPMKPAPPVTTITSLLISIRMEAEWKEVRQLGQPRVITVARYEHRTIAGDRPFNPDLRIVPDEPALGGRVVVGRHLVDYLGVRLERTIAMSKTDRNVELLPVLGAQHDLQVPPECRRPASNVHRDIENAAARAADQLRLGRRADLKVHASNRPDRTRESMILLDEPAIDAGMPHRIFAPYFGEEAPIVTVTTRLDNSYAGHVGIGNDIQRRHDDRSILRSAAKDPGHNRHPTSAPGQDTRSVAIDTVRS